MNQQRKKFQRGTTAAAIIVLMILTVCTTLLSSCSLGEAFMEGYREGAGITDSQQDNESTKAPKVTKKPLDESSYKADCDSYAYDSLARNPDTYKDLSVVFTGKVIQVLEEGNDVVLRVNVTRDEYGYYEDTVYVTYTRSADEGRILEDDIITFYGNFEGLITYETVLGSTLTIPHVEAKFIDLVK